MERKRLVKILLSCAFLVALLIAVRPTSAASLTRVTNFGNNPSNLNMYIYVPDNVAARPALLVAIHYCTGTASALYSGSFRDYVTAADQYGYIIVFPEATRSGQCFDVYSSQALTRGGGSDPVGIISMVNYAKQNYNVDPSRVYVSGASSGAMMTNVMAAEYPDVFAAGSAFMGVPATCFATTGGSTWNSDCANGNIIKTAQQWGDAARAMGGSGTYPRMQLWHGTTDTTLNYNNFGEEIKQWTNLKGVSQTPVLTDSPQSGWTRTRYGSNTTQAPVEGISINGVGHALPTSGMIGYAISFLGLNSVTTPTTPPPTTPPVTTPPPGTISINAGGSATGSFTADQYFSGGSTYTNSNTIDTSQVGSVPAAVFQSERYGAMTYTIPNRSGAQTVTLYFAETYVTAAGQRLFNVSINGATVLSSFDIYAAAGGQNRAIARSFNTTANASGQVVIQFIAGTQSPKINGITVAGGPPPTTPPATTPPVTTPPATTPPVTTPPATTPPATTPPPGSVSINAGGSATGSFTADQYFSGGSTYTNSNTIDTSQVGSVPAAVFQSERYGAMTYTIPNRSGAQTVTLYFAETYVTAAGQRLFNVSINGATVLSSFDIYATAGGQNRAIARSFTTTANASGQVVIQFIAGTQNPKINGITVAGGSPTPTTPPPTTPPVTTPPPTTPPPTTPPVTTPPPSAVSINAGGSATGSFGADQYYSGGSTYTNTATIDMSQVTTNPPPAAVFNTERYGAMTYTIPNRSGAQTVTLYFAETYLTAAGQRVFNVSINGAAALSNFDIYASAGGANRAIARTFSTTANSSGQVVIQFTAVTENPKINGITLAGGGVNSSYQRGPDPTLASVAATRGTFATAQVSVPVGNGFGGGTIYYPTDTSLGTWAAVAICPGYSARFANEEAWMGPWLASFGFVVIGMETNTTSDGADARATQLLAALDYLTQQSSVRDRVDPNRLMVMGHSAGGAGALTAALQRSSLKTVVGLAPGAPNNSLSMSNLRMPVMIIGGQNDTTVTPSYLNGIWTSISSTTQRAWVELAGNDHLSFTRSNGTEMRVLIPWMKIFLDNDTRYTQFLCPLADSSGISNYSNSCPFVP